MADITLLRVVNVVVGFISIKLQLKGTGHIRSDRKIGEQNSAQPES